MHAGNTPQPTHTALPTHDTNRPRVDSLAPLPGSRLTRVTHRGTSTGTGTYDKTGPPCACSTLHPNEGHTPCATQSQACMLHALSFSQRCRIHHWPSIPRKASRGRHPRGRAARARRHNRRNARRLVTPPCHTNRPIAARMAREGAPLPQEPPQVLSALAFPSRAETGARRSGAV